MNENLSPTEPYAQTNLDEAQERILSLVDDGKYIEACELLVLYPPAFCAQIIENLNSDEKDEVFFRLPIENAADILMELTEDSLHELIDKIYDDTLIKLLKELETDDAVDILQMVPEEQAQRVLEILPNEFTRLFLLPEDTAGGIMESEYASLPGDMTIGRAVLVLKKFTERIDEIFQIFLVDKKNRLIGILPVQRLLINDRLQRLDSIADRPDFVITVDQDQEEAAKMFRQNDLISAPVVDEDGKLIGRITIDDIIDVLDEEATEDSYRMVGIGGEEYSPSSFHLIKGRLPWLVMSLGAEIISGLVITHFDATLREFVILASFIPLIMAMGGNVGVQSATVVIRRIALDTFQGINRRRLIFKEISAGMILGLIFAIVLTFVGLSWGNIKAGMVAGIAIFTAMTISCTVGCFFPIILKRFGQDPASATGPFITAFNDVLGLFIYFLIATALLVKL
ncbi:MAG: magnesium transporter [Candidatus Zixiibacteriota bacterium]